MYLQDEYNNESVYMYLNRVHPNIADNYYPKPQNKSDIPNLLDIIENDNKLEKIYSPNVFILKVDDIEYKLESQIIKSNRDIIYLTDESIIKLYIKKVF